MALAADDPMVAQVGEDIGPVLELIERGETEIAARDFIENIAIGPGAWEMMSEEERASTVAHAPTFAEEQRDPAWAEIDLDALRAIDFPVLFTRGDQSPALLLEAHRAASGVGRPRRGDDAARRSTRSASDAPRRILVRDQPIRGPLAQGLGAFHGAALRIWLPRQRVGCTWAETGLTQRRPPEPSASPAPAGPSRFA